MSSNARGANTDSPSLVVTYDDQITRNFLWATIIWGIVGMAVGALIALQLAWWPANGGLPFLSFGRLRPLHTNAVVFAFAGNAVFVALYYTLQRLLKTRMWSDVLSKIHFWGWQAIIVSVALTIPLGITQGKEYAEMEWPIDVAIAVVWVLMLINVIGTIAIRRVKHLYVSIWFYLASIITVAMLHVVNGLAIPVSLTKSYVIYSGVKDALVQWWYGHNAVGFLLTTPFLGMMYYFIPKAVEKPVYSYRLSVIHFWSLIFLYIWSGPHHLLYTALPEWAQSLGMVFSIMLIAPSWGGMLNGLLTMRGSWEKVRTDPVLKFYVMALTFYGMATLEGPLMSIKSWNKLTHYTDYTIAHVHGGALGWVGGMIFGVTYWLVPKLFNRPLFSKKMAEWHFWLATLGMIMYLGSMWTAGLVEGLMTFATNEEGLLRYPQFLETVQSVQPLFWIRLVGGLLYLLGAILCLVNICKTCSEVPADQSVRIVPERHIAPTTWHERLENKGLALGALAAVAVAIGGVIEFLPTFAIESNIPKIAAVRPYSPLELMGRDIYIREGCFNCHSQEVRVLDLEVQRYGRYSESGEFVYDYPHQWGSKRTGPDLHRIGGKYPNIWHYKHMLDPRSLSPGSVMPAYTWLAEDMAKPADIKKNMEALKKLGVPYSEQEIEEAANAYTIQAKGIVGDLQSSSVNVGENSELVALIAYLQRLGTDIKKEPSRVESAQNP